MESEDAAIELMRATDAGSSAPGGGSNEGVVGYVAVGADGVPGVHVRGGALPDSVDSANQSVLKTVVDNYLSSRALIEDVANEDPAALADTRFVAQLLDAPDFTERIDVTRNPPKETVRYYFALLGMAALFGGQTGMIAICRAQPNLSALGARRALGAVSRAKTLVATLGASWTLSFACLAAAYAYIRVAAGMDFEAATERASSHWRPRRFSRRRWARSWEARRRSTRASKAGCSAASCACPRCSPDCTGSPSWSWPTS